MNKTMFTLAIGLAATTLSLGTASNAHAVGNYTLHCYLSEIVINSGGLEWYYNLSLRDAKGQVKRIQQLGVPVQGTPFDVVLLTPNQGTAGTQGLCYVY